MHMMFRIGNITSMGENHRLFRVELTLNSDRIQEETFSDEEGWYRLGQVLLKMAHPWRSQRVYEILLEQETKESAETPIYHQLGYIKDDLGEYQESIRFLKKPIEIEERFIPLDHQNLANSYNNISSLYSEMDEYITIRKHAHLMNVP